MGKAGSTLIQWQDYEGYFYLETSSEKLVETLAASGIRWTERDEETGLFCYKLPAAWLRLRTKYGLLKLGWYRTKQQKGCLALYEDRPQLEVVK